MQQPTDARAEAQTHAQTGAASSYIEHAHSLVCIHRVHTELCWMSSNLKSRLALLHTVSQTARV